MKKILYQLGNVRGKGIQNSLNFKLVHVVYNIYPDNNYISCSGELNSRRCM